MFAEQQCRRADAHVHVVRLVLVRVDAIVHERPEHASRIQRHGHGPVNGAGHRGPAEECPPVECETYWDVKKKRVGNKSMYEGTRARIENKEKGVGVVEGGTYRGQLGASK